MTCTGCGKIVEKFSNGKKCRDCYNAYMRTYNLERYHRRRADAIALLGGKCAWCGSTEQLEVDHRDRTQKEVELSNAGVAEAKYWKEVTTKCHLLCRYCHRVKTAGETAVEHGGGVSGKRNCPCEPCRARKSEYMKNWKKQRS